jgi:hypothetical protein
MENPLYAQQFHRECQNRQGAGYLVYLTLGTPELSHYLLLLSFLLGAVWSHCKRLLAGALHLATQVRICLDFLSLSIIVLVQNNKVLFCSS